MISFASNKFSIITAFAKDREPEIYGEGGSKPQVPKLSCFLLEKV